mgnify:CR=1 FL=1
MPYAFDFLSIADIAKRLEKKEISPVELAEAHLQRIHTLDPRLNAFLTITTDLARKQARAAEQEIMKGHYKGPLHGIPIGLKDIYNTAGVRTTGHSKVALHNKPAQNATTVQKLFQAGAVLMGKLATHEFAHGGPSFDLPWPPARNPWQVDHFTGGSSSGPAAAVAAGLVLGALGSDTGGSIRTPASLCGIVGFKPTYGLISRNGVIPNSYSFDHCGPMARTVEDCALMLEALAGHDHLDPASARHPIPDYRQSLIPDIQGFRIGVMRSFWDRDHPVSAELNQAMEAALTLFTELGAEVEEVKVPPLQEYYDVKIVIAETEIFAVHQHDLRKQAANFGKDFLARCLPACFFSAVDYVQAQRRRRQLINAMHPLYEQYDVLVMAGEGPAPRFDQCQSELFRNKPNFSTVFNVTGGPALAICNGFTKDGLPLSMQIAAQPFAETKVLQAAYAYEQATSWHTRHPELKLDTPVKPPPRFPPQVMPEMPEEIYRYAEHTAKQFDLSLASEHFQLLCTGATSALAMADRVRRKYSWKEEPANVFDSNNRPAVQTE